MARTKQTARILTGPTKASRVPRIRDIKPTPPVISREQLTSWLKLNRLIHQKRTTEQILKDALTDIIQSLGSVKDLFIFISNNAKQESQKLELIRKSISKQILKSQNENANNPKISESESEQKTNIFKKKRNTFDTVSNESISAIVSYLGKREVQTLKRTDRRNGIICLEEMSKSLVGTINSHQLRNVCNLYNFDTKQMLFDRYHSSTKHCALYEQWSKQFNIPIQNQLIFNLYNKKAKHKIKHTSPIFDSVAMEMADINKTQKFLILNNRKVTILKDDKPRKFNIEQDTYENIQKFELIILEYFDIFTQTTKIVQYLLYNNDMSHKRLFDYIQNAFIPMPGSDSDWYTELQTYLNQMSNEHSKLNIYQHTQGKLKRKRRYVHYDPILKKPVSKELPRASNKSLSFVDPNSTANIKFENSFYRRLFTFQLNYKHPWCKSSENVQNKVQNMKLKCKERKDTFYHSLDSFCSETVYVRVHFRGDMSLLQSIMKHKFESKMKQKNNGKTSVISQDWDAIMSCIEKQCLEIKMSKTSKSYVLRQKISKYLFNDIISPQNIELFSIDGFQQIKWNATIGDIRNVYYSVVLYDTQPCAQ